MTCWQAGALSAACMGRAHDLTQGGRMLMTWMLVTRMSGAGTSTLLRALPARGYATVDTADDG